MLRHSLRMLAGATALASTVLLGSCSGDSTGGGTGTVKDYFSAVQAVVATPSVGALPAAGRAGAAPKAARASFSSATPPTVTYHDGNTPTGGGPTVVGSAESTPLFGRPFRYGISANNGFTTIYISVQGVTGYWQIDLGATTTLADLILTLAANPPSTTFTLQSAVGTGSSAGTPATTQITATDLSQSDISVVLTWTGASDVDLHVTDAKGQEVYYGNTTTAEGGHLDLDSNAGCSIDNVNQEIISWPKDKAPTGSYTVSVQYYAACDQTSAPWTLTINRKGHTAITSSGTFTGAAGNNQPAVQPAFQFP